MNIDPTTPQPAPESDDDAGKLSPPDTRWSPPQPRLRGVRFKGPVAKIITVDSPIRPAGHA